MRRPIIAGNWKMYKTIPEALEFVRDFKPQVVASTHCEIVIAPVFTAIKAVVRPARGLKCRGCCSGRGGGARPRGVYRRSVGRNDQRRRRSLGDNRSLGEATVLR